MVAKTFQNLEQVGEPFESGGKMYINVLGKNGNVRRVRWYEPYEYVKMYPEVSIEEIDPFYKSKRRTLFGDSDFIWIFKSDTETNSDLLEASPYVYYNTYWGWYIRDDAPQEIFDAVREKFIIEKLYWKDVFIDDETLKDKKEIEKIIKRI